MLGTAIAVGAALVGFIVVWALRDSRAKADIAVVQVQLDVSERAYGEHVMELAKARGSAEALGEEYRQELSIRVAVEGEEE